MGERVQPWDLRFIHADGNPVGKGVYLLKRVEELNLENSGKFWHMNGEELPW